MKDIEEALFRWWRRSAAHLEEPTQELIDFLGFRPVPEADCPCRQHSFCGIQELKVVLKTGHRPSCIYARP